MDALFYLAVLIFIFKMLSGLEGLLVMRNVGWLKDTPTPSKGCCVSLPKVSIIIPAMNEAENIEKALTSVLSLAYAHTQVLVINDRSTDSTGEILNQMALRYPQLTVFHVKALPDGWLGKNHALHFGAQQAKGEYLLFTDADVIQESTALDRAIAYMLENNLDHLTISPNILCRGILLNSLMMAFMINFSRFVKPWKVKDPKSKHHIGIGAFNLIRTKAYWDCGTLEKIAMRPDDDLKLGKLLKQQGFRQGYLFGKEFLSVEWYPSVKEMINGLMKNSFAVFEYRVLLVIVGLLALFIVDIWPFIAVFLSGGWTQWLYVIIIFMIYLENGCAAFLIDKTPLYALASPVGSLLMVYIPFRATLLTLIHQGISWRGTHYPLEKLKSNRI
ncbi:MAG: glycosyltransferase [Desulfatitalea sp.]|nr:glycosyltransferase [Desulfatitalea sp.]